MVQDREGGQGKEAQSLVRVAIVHSAADPPAGVGSNRCRTSRETNAKSPHKHNFAPPFLALPPCLELRHHPLHEVRDPRLHRRAVFTVYHKHMQCVTTANPRRSCHRSRHRRSHPVRQHARPWPVRQRCGAASGCRCRPSYRPTPQKHPGTRTRQTSTVTPPRA